MEARELEVQQMSRSLNLKAVIKSKSKPATSTRGSKSTKRGEQAPESANSQLASQRCQTPSGAPPTGIEEVSLTVAPPYSQSG